MKFHGSPLAPGLAIVVQIRELSSSSLLKFFVLGSAIAVQTKEHVISTPNFLLQLCHRGTSQGVCMVLVSTIPLNVACASSY